MITETRDSKPETEDDRRISETGDSRLKTVGWAPRLAVLPRNVALGIRSTLDSADALPYTYGCSFRPGQVHTGQHNAEQSVNALKPKFIPKKHDAAGVRAA